MTNQTQYVALTTHGGNFWVVLIGEAGQEKEAVREAAERQICGNQWDQAKDIYVDTELKNLTVVAWSSAVRKFRRAMDRYEIEQEV